MTYFQYSNDPFVDALCKMMIVIFGILAIIFIIGYIFTRMMQKKNKDKSGKSGKSGKSEKSDKSRKNTKSRDKDKTLFWVFIVIVVLFFLSIYLKMALDRVKVVDDPAIRQRYSWLYNYSARDFTTPFYQRIYQIVSWAAIIFNFGLVLGSRGGSYQEVV